MEDLVKERFSKKKSRINGSVLSGPTKPGLQSWESTVRPSQFSSSVRGRNIYSKFQHIFVAEVHCSQPKEILILHIPCFEGKIPPPPILNLLRFFASFWTLIPQFQWRFYRSILALSSRRSIQRFPRQINPPLVPSVSKDFSTKSHQNVGQPGGAGQPPKSKSSLPAVLLGSTALAGAAFLAYQSGYLDQFISKEQQLGDKSPIEVKGTHMRKDVVPIIAPETKKSDDVVPVEQDVAAEIDIDVARIEDVPKIITQTEPTAVEDDKKADLRTDLPRQEVEEKTEPSVDFEQKHDTQTSDHQQDLSSEKGEIPSQVEELSKPIVEDATSVPGENHEAQVPTTVSSEGSHRTVNPESASNEEPNREGEAPVISKENEIKTLSADHSAEPVKSEVELGKGVGAPNLLNTYHLKENTEIIPSTEGPGEEGSTEESAEGYLTKDGKLVMDFLQAIHAAEKRQHELDARVFTGEKRALQEKYEKELRDSRVRELMRAEEAAMLDKEIKRVKAKAAAAVRAVEEKSEEKLRLELEQKEAEAETNMKRVQELAKAELAAAIASEKAAQIERIAEANLHGALALEDALSQGLPIQKELEALGSFLEGTDKDSLVQLVLSTLPEETRHTGTDTVLQLNQKFNALKGTLRHHILIPPGGGGILTHAMAQIASWLRLKEVDPSGDGIESVISKVQTLLSEGKLAEAADALQEGVGGSQAEQVASDWVRRAKNRAITEQALTVLQSYATCISLTRS
ncbi:MICOS complex subunit mic60 [Linum grandiflorum]